MNASCLFVFWTELRCFCLFYKPDVLAIPQVCILHHRLQISPVKSLKSYLSVNEKTVIVKRLASCYALFSAD